MPMRVSGMNSGIDTEAIVADLVNAYSKKTEKFTKEQTKIEWKQETWKNLNTQIYSLYTNASNMRYNSGYAMKKATVSDASKATVTAGEKAMSGRQSLKIKDTAQTAYLTGGEIGLTSAAQGADTKKEGVKETTTLSEIGFVGTSASFYVDVEGKQKEIKVKNTSTIADVVESLKEAGVNASFDKDNKRIFVGANKTGEKYNFDITSFKNTSVKDENGETVTSSTEAGVSALKALGLFTAQEAEKLNQPVEGIKNLGMKVDGIDARIELNGMTYTSETNNFSINGLEILANAKTGNNGEDAISIDVGADAQAVYDKIKDFFTEYNNVINTITKYYNAESAKDYEPLTDEEKDAMSETEVEKWETKIKDSLLRRDSTLGSIMNSMVNSMNQSFEVNGEKFNLGKLGISTLGYLNAAKNENYAYHIDGDEDDKNTADKQDKLMAAITKDPDSVIEFMKQLTSNLYSEIDKKMKSTSLSSAYKVYNDKELTKQYDQYSKNIKEWEDRVSEKEDYYYRKFTQMEKALAQVNSKNSALTGLFG